MLAIAPIEIAATLGVAMAKPVTIPGSLGQPPICVPRYAAELRQVFGRIRIADYGKGLAARVDDGTGFPTFAELYVASRLKTAGWACTWASAYGGLRFVESWAWDARHPVLLSPPQDVLQTLQRIADTRQSLTKRAKRSFGGITDVVAWRDSDLLMLECKRRDEDRIRRTQEEWMHAAVLAGMQVAQLGIFEWGYATSYRQDV